MESPWVTRRRERLQKDPAEILGARIAKLVPSLEPFAVDIAKEMLNRIAEEDGYFLVPKRDVVEVL
jgi:hypothetical protein